MDTTDFPENRQKKAEEAFKASDARCKAIFDAVNDAIFVIDPQSGAILEVNRKMTEMYGYTADEARNLTVEDVSQGIPPYDREAALGKIMIAVEQGASTFEWRCKHKSGWILTTEVSLRPAVIDGRTCVVAVVRDITDRKRAEDALKKMEETLRRSNEELESKVAERTGSIEQTGEGITLAGPGGAIEYVNPAFVGITGYSREEPIGKTCDSFAEHLAGNDMRGIFDSVAKEGKTWSGRQIRKRNTGEIIEINLSVSAVCDKQGRIINYVSVIQDATSEVRMQRQLAQKQKMEAIGSLAGGIAHDLKNILTPIMLNTEMALEDVGERRLARPVLEEALDAEEAAQVSPDLSPGPYIQVKVHDTGYGHGPGGGTRNSKRASRSDNRAKHARRRLDVQGAAAGAPGRPGRQRMQSRADILRRLQSFSMNYQTESVYNL